MTHLHHSSSAEAPASAQLATAWTDVAQQCLSMTLRFDYLSGRRGLQASRPVVQERLATSQRSASRAGQPNGLVPSHGERERQALDDAERHYLGAIAAKPRLTSREEYCLVVRMRSGSRQAHTALVEANLGLVVMFARRYQRPGVPLLDLVAEGNLGLLRATRSFDPERGYRFGTYAKWWVMQSMRQAMPKLAGVVRIPLSQANAARVAADAARRSNTGLAAGPGWVDDGPAGGLDDGTVAEAASDAANLHRSDADADADAQTPSPRDGAVVEGHEDWHETNDADVLESIAGDPEREPPAVVMAGQRRRLLSSALETLGERERIVVSARFALVGDRPSTLDELATRLQVSIERVRQIENQAVKNLAKVFRRAGQSVDSLL